MRWKRKTPSYEPGPPDPWDIRVLDILRARDGQLSIVELTDGTSLRVWNIAWGYDAGDSCAHVSSNMSPGAPEGDDFDFFFTSDVAAIRSAPPASQLLLLRSAD